MLSIDLGGQDFARPYRRLSRPGAPRGMLAQSPTTLTQRLKEEGVRDTRVEGMPLCDWVLIDAGDVIVHASVPGRASSDNLEKMWGSERPKPLADEINAFNRNRLRVEKVTGSSITVAF